LNVPTRKVIQTLHKYRLYWCEDSGVQCSNRSGHNYVAPSLCHNTNKCDHKQL